MAVIKQHRHSLEVKGQTDNCPGAQGVRGGCWLATEAVLEMFPWATVLRSAVKGIFVLLSRRANSELDKSVQESFPATEISALL